MTEVEQEAEGVKVGEAAGGVAPLLDEIVGVLRRQKERLQERGGVIVEAQITRAELLFENRHAGKQGEGAALGAVGRAQPYLAFALEERAGDAAANVLGEG